MEKMGTQYIGYVGTYTRQSSKGIYRFILDADTGKLTMPEVAAEVGSPTYLAISEDRKFLYSVAQQEKLGGVAAFQIVNAAGELKLLNMEVEEGVPPCHLDVYVDHLVTGNYHEGKVVLYDINHKGKIEPFIDVVEHQGGGPHERQEKPHVHYTALTPNKDYVVVVDLGTDELVTYKIENFELVKVHTLHVKPGSGPRHLTFHPNGKWAYLLTELSSEVMVLDYDQASGSFSEKQTILAKPEDFAGQNDASAIHISPDGRFLYTGNRGDNSLAVFQVDETNGIVELVEFTSTGGEWPRDFCLDPSGNYLVVANQHTGNLVLFSRNQETGKLTQLDSEVKVPEGVCVKFL
ncbi:lactonase family protein [Lederbergia sp. NSJ-179]|uniref:lactonase family protein n=1 Tax=Lederbergia sp. NSJ-179 TaxID=2931402 RepID=UPI001FD4E1E8|nr:lactonase family protein [Lederbergia sp. NSJ-179]MCJ7841510.1 lactonase family protein [Lederbergia sp. NSJ-179]